MFSLIKRKSSYLAFMLNMCRSNLTSSSYAEKVSTSSRKPFCFFDIFGHFLICILNIFTDGIFNQSLICSHAKFLQFNDVLRAFLSFMSVSNHSIKCQWDSDVSFDRDVTLC